MEGEDWPDPLPKGWALKQFSDKVWAHNKETGQTFRTKKDLLRYLHYDKYVLPLLSKNNSSSKDLVDASSSKGVDEDSSSKELAATSSSKRVEKVPSSKELVAASSSKGVEKDSSSKDLVAVSSSKGKAVDNAGGCNDSLYESIDFSKGIWSANVEIIETCSFHAPVPVTNDVLSAHKNNERSNKKMKVQVDQQPDTKMGPEPKPKPKSKPKPKPKPKPKSKLKLKTAPEPQLESEAEEELEAEAGAEAEPKTGMESDHGESKKRGGRRKKIELPPKRFRGFRSLDNQLQKP